MTDTNTTETNGSSNGSNGDATKGPSTIAKLIKQHNDTTENGKKLPSKKVQEELLADFKKLLAARDKAQKEFDAATKAFGEHAPAMVLAFGDMKIDVNGRLYFAASRGDTVFYREEGKQDPKRIIKA